MGMTVGIYTLGCKVNQYESVAIGEALEARGFALGDPDGLCDAYIINTCTVTAESDRKARQFIRRARSHNPQAYILVTGCFSQVSPAQVSAITGVDYICGTANKMSLIDALCALCEKGAKEAVPVCALPHPDQCDFESMEIHHFDRTRAYVKIEDGCESHCAYCIIPQARGKIRSKSLEETIREVQILTEGGCREVVLTGIETGSWGKDLPQGDLADLLEAVDRIPGIGRVRLGSLDPSIMKPAFISRIAALPSLAPHFHLSLQSGSSSVLARMRRKYNAEQARTVFENVRRMIPHVQFTTDIITGFPGETEEEFEETLAFVRQARFLTVHAFPYSKRAGTPAAVMPNQVPEEIKHARVHRLQEVSAAVRRELLAEAVSAGGSVSVLFETYDPLTATACGHTPSFIDVQVAAAENWHGCVKNVRLTDVLPDSSGCRGCLVP